MTYILALDQGTTSSRAIVFDHQGAIRGVDQREFPQHFPQPGWVEHDPDDIWRSQLETAQGALKNAGVAASELVAVGITNQRETTTLWDRKTGRPVYRSIVWQDRRTAPICEKLKAAGYGEVVSEKTGLLLDPYFSGTKVAWMLDNVEGLRARAERGEIAFGTVDSWLIYNLTGGAVHATDYTNASRTLLFNLRTLDWDDELLKIFNVPRSLLPEARPCVADFGAVLPRLFGGSIRIAGVAGDQQAALIGQAGFEKGLAKNTYGTGCFLMLNTGSDIVRSTSGLISTVAFSSQRGKALYALEGSIFVTGSAVQWLRDGLGIISTSAEVEQLASRVEDTGGVFFVPAFVGLGAPYWDPYARGTIVGLTRGSTKEHLARAALESIAYQSYDVVKAMETDSKVKLAELRVDGGAVVDNLLMQFQSDVLGVDVVRPRVTETTALGAAYCAGLHVGFWRDAEEVSKQWQEEHRFRTALADDRRETLLAGWRHAVTQARA
ncbi:MAG TPA: glycerol kinase GlpK [Candidatus Baltobacteraceae bacterium]|nr:glycerol kinase GlpK [Candidatus Baltobacteraceae bacterium]